MKTVVKDGTSLRPVPDEAPPEDSAGEMTVTTPVPGVVANLRPAGFLGTREQIQEELDSIAQQVRFFHMKQPDQVMRECGAYSARLTELAVLLHRQEAFDRQYTRIRTAQVQRWLDELAVQFKIASRLVEVSRQDIELMRGS